MSIADICSQQDFFSYQLAFTNPNKAHSKIQTGSALPDRTVGIIHLGADEFCYSKEKGYCMELAVMAELVSARPLLFIRVDSFDPAYRAKNDIDFCIPLAQPGLSEVEELASKIPFGGAWSDSQEEAILVFDESWKDWFRQITSGLAFTVRGAQTAAFIELDDRHRTYLNKFLQA